MYLQTGRDFNISKPHPWHGIPVGPDPANGVVTAYIEITQFDTVKYELDKATGFLRVDRPQRTSSSPPTLYGFVPKTLCAERCAEIANLPKGDMDPLDICILSERPISRSDIIMDVVIIGGLLMEDGGEADDKIVAVLKGDAIWGNCADISEIPHPLIERLEHYFLTYKLRLNQVADLIRSNTNAVKIYKAYGREHAVKVL